MLVAPAAVMAKSLVLEAIQEEPTIVQNQQPSSDQVVVKAQAYVQLPNFDVIREVESQTLTLLFNAQQPDHLEGIVLRLHDQDLTTVNKVIQNLNINQVILYQRDEALVESIVGDVGIIVK